MKNEQRSNLQFIAEITDISKMDLAGLNEITGYKDPEEETTGIEDLEALAQEMEERYEVCQYCGEEAGLVKNEEGIICDACLDQIEKEEEAIRKANEMNDNEIGDWWDWRQNHANK